MAAAVPVVLRGCAGMSTDDAGLFIPRWSICTDAVGGGMHCGSTIVTNNELYVVYYLADLMIT